MPAPPELGKKGLHIGEEVGEEGNVANVDEAVCTSSLANLYVSIHIS